MTRNSNPSILDIMGRHFNVFDEMFGNSSVFNNKISVPYNTTLQNESTYRVEIALAGYKKEDLEVFIEKGYLHVNVNANVDNSTDTDNFEQRFRRVSSSYEEPKITSYPYILHQGITQKKLSLTFGVPKNANDFDANFADGILTIDIKTEPQKPDRVSISIK